MLVLFVFGRFRWNCNGGLDSCFRFPVYVVFWVVHFGFGFVNFLVFLLSLLSGQQSCVTIRRRVRLFLLVLFGCRLVVLVVGLVLDRVTRVDVILTLLLLADNRDDRLKDGMMNRWMDE